MHAIQVNDIVDGVATQDLHPPRIEGRRRCTESLREFGDQHANVLDALRGRPGTKFDRLGKPPGLAPAHHVERPTGIGPCGAMIEASRTKPV